MHVDLHVNFLHAINIPAPRPDLTFLPPTLENSRPDFLGAAITYIILFWDRYLNMEIRPCLKEAVMLCVLKDPKSVGSRRPGYTLV